ncbi:hypothetical protein ILUMI_26642 [Ignelater luminosus]|uniref:RRM domain-containing protein n=1 Tax=Ignelater luminosus TaxID=2038154 RepID=A0A8K0C663_IGNLU|nr:hypothetical protein ILUMI_26642 [Ignelater luminosus]
MEKLFLKRKEEEKSEHKRLYLSNIPITVTVNELTDWLTKYVPAERIASINKNYANSAIVTFEKPIYADRVFFALKNAKLANARIKVQWSRPKTYHRRQRITTSQAVRTGEGSSIQHHPKSNSPKAETSGPSTVETVEDVKTAEAEPESANGEPESANGEPESANKA